MKKAICSILISAILAAAALTPGLSALLKGDVNADGAVNNKDVVSLFKFVSSASAYDAKYDFNGDGAVNNKDVVNIFKYVSSGAPAEEQHTADEYFVYTVLEDGSYDVRARNVENMPEDVVIPSSHKGRPVTKIGETAFRLCRTIKNVEVPDSVKIIDNYAFDRCANLSRIALPEGLETIGFGAFNECTALEEVNIPSTVKEILYGAFK